MRRLPIAALALAAACGGHTVALVDDDGYVGAGGTTDQTLLQAYEGYLAAVGIKSYDVISIPASGGESWSPTVVPTSSQLAQYTTIIWFTADNAKSDATGDDPPLSSDQETALASWLANGGNTLVIFSEYLVAQNAGNKPANWTEAPTDPILGTALPLQGAVDDPEALTGAQDEPIASGSVTVTGGSTVSAAFGGLSWTLSAVSALAANTPSTFTVGAMNPGEGVDTLATVLADPTAGGLANKPVAVAVGKKATSSTESTVVYVGVEPYNLGGSATQEQFTSGIFAYAGLPK